METHCILTPSNFCKSLFSVSEYALTNRRRKVLPSNLERQLFFSVNGEFWDFEVGKAVFHDGKTVVPTSDWVWTVRHRVGRALHTLHTLQYSVQRCQAQYCDFFMATCSSVISILYGPCTVLKFPKSLILNWNLLFIRRNTFYSKNHIQTHSYALFCKLFIADELNSVINKWYGILGWII